MPSEEKSDKPRQMVHKAQAEAIEWIYRYQQIHQGLSDSMSRDEARAGMHNAVLLYWKQIDRFSHRGRIESEWHEEHIFDDTTLEDIREKLLSTKTEVTTEYDASKGKEEQVRVEKPWRLTPRQALRVHDQLDKCAHRLGFDASPKQTEPTYGWVEAGDEIADETGGSADA